MRNTLIVGLIAAIAFVMPYTAFAAQIRSATTPFAEATADIMLSVRADHSTREVSLAEIESLEHFEITMNAPGGDNGTFSGVLLVDLLKHLGLDNAERLHMRAADDYKVTLLPSQDEGFDQVLFVTRLNGLTTSIAENGPFRLIWAHDADGAEAGSVSTAKWIWSIVEIRKVR